MTLQVLSTVISEELAFVTVRQRIYDILVAELANQFTLSNNDPVFSINVYQERYNPWLGGNVPLVNVFYDTGNILGSSGVASKDQMGDHFYNMDLYYNVPSEMVNEIVVFGDTESQKEVQKGASIIYQIIGADFNTRLQFPSKITNPSPPPITLPNSFIGARQFTELIAFKPTFGDHFVEDVTAFRLRLKVRHTELMPQIAGLDLDAIDTTLIRKDTTLDKEIEINIEP
jgi:hypothetical protein